MTEYSPLQAELKKLIQSSGPMPVWRYMELCLTHPQHGYYAVSYTHLTLPTNREV